MLDFVRDCGLKLMVSVANCPGLHSTEEPWPSTEAEKLFSLSKEYGVPIEAAEFANEPNMMEETGFPKGYKAEHYRRDTDLFAKWLKANYPECLYVGPSAVGGDDATLLSHDESGEEHGVGGIEQLAGEIVGCEKLLGGTTEKLDVFSYHYYNGVSERLASVFPAGHWLAEQANSEAYLNVAIGSCKTYVPFRDKFCPGGEMWVTESGDAGGGGDTWASTYLDVIRTLNELGGFSQLTRGVIFHNTLAASDYAYLARHVHDPRPNYFAVLLWQKLMGTTVYETEPVRMGAHVFCHSRKDGKEGKVYLVINNSETDTTEVELPTAATVYTLSGKDGNKRATVMALNGRDLMLGDNWELPDLSGQNVAAGKLYLAPMTCTFIVL